MYIVVGDVIRIETPTVFNHFNQYWRTVTMDQFAVFRVRACSDCHVALSPTLGVDCGEKKYIDLIISGWQNSLSQITRVIGDTCRLVLDVLTIVLLHSIVLFT